MQNSLLVFIVCQTICLFLVVASCSGQEDLSSQRSSNSKLDTQFEKHIRPLLQKYCIDCHEPGEMAGLDFLAAKSAADVFAHRGLFAGVVEQMEQLEMPPKNFDQPTDRERKMVVDWLKKTLGLKPSDTDRIAPYVVEVYEDQKGHLWFGTVSKGVARYDGKTLNWFSAKDGFPSSAVTSIAEDKAGNLWFGTHKGLCRYNGKTFETMWTTTGRPDQGEGWMGVKADKIGNIWTSTNNGVFRHDGSSFSEFKIPIVKEKVSSFSITAGKASLKLEDRNGNLWFGTDGDGVYRFDGKSFTHWTTRNGLCSDTVTNIVEDKQGNIWFACIQSFQPKMTGNGGVCVFDGKEITTFSDVKGLNQNDIYTLYETRQGDMWIGATGVGAYRYDGKSFKLFSETDRSFSTRYFGVQGILEARNGTLWFGFSGGLFRFTGRTFINVTEKGPWDGLVVAMATAITGGYSDSRLFPPETNKALSAIGKGEFQQAATRLLDLKRKAPDDITIQERTVTMLGYQLIGMRRLELAIEVFKLNTQLHPSHFNTYDSLGEAYLLNGDEELGVKNYKKSLQLNPENNSASEALAKLSARKKYEKMLVAPKDWLEEVLIVPPSFAPKMRFKGMEHLRLPPEFRDLNSDWFCSYLFAIELTEPTELNEANILDQLLIYFRGLAAGGRDKNGKQIDTNKFSVDVQAPKGGPVKNEYLFTMRWQEPFVNATPLKQNIRVKLVFDKNQHGVLFVCASPQPLHSAVWSTLLEIRSAFESAPLPAKSNPTEAKPARESATPPPEYLEMVRDKQRATGYGAGDVVSAGLLDKAGNLWFCTSNEGVYRYDGKAFRNYSKNEGLSSNHVWSVVEDKEGVLWFGTADGLCRFNGTVFTHVPIPGGDRDSKMVLSLLSDQKGNLWIGTYGSGAYRYDGESFTSFLKNEGRIQRNGRHSNVIQSMTEDSTGNIWFTSMTHGGVSRYDGEKITHFTRKDGLSDDMVFSSFADSSGNTWFGTRDNGLNRFDGKTLSQFTESEGLRNNCVSCIYEDKTGKLWIGSGRSGMCCFDGKSFTSFPPEVGSELIDIRFIVEDRAGTLWFGGRFGVLWRYDGNTLADFTIKKRQ